MQLVSRAMTTRAIQPQITKVFPGNVSTLQAGITSYCMCPLFFLLSARTIEDLCDHVCVFCVSADGSVLMQEESRSRGDVAIDMDSPSNPLQLQLIDEQVGCWCLFAEVRQVAQKIYSVVKLD